MAKRKSIKKKITGPSNGQYETSNPYALLGGAVLGGAIGAKRGAKSAGKKFNARVRNTSSYGGNEPFPYVKGGNTGWDTQRPDRLATAAMREGWNARAPRGSMLADEVNTAMSRRGANISAGVGVNKMHSEEAKSMLRGAKKIAMKQGAKRGAAKGIIAGGALSVLAQLVAAELRGGTKRRG